MRFFYITAAERELVLRVATVLAIPLCLVILLPSVLGIWLVNREATIRSSENRALIIESRQADREAQDVLVSFVCAAVAVADEAGTPESQLRAARFKMLLTGIDRSCG